MASTFPLDPVLNHKFSVIVEGIGKLGTSELSGLEDESEVVEYREGCDPLYMRKLSGMTSVGNITIKKGITTDSAQFLQWRREVTKNSSAQNARRTVIVQVNDGAGKVVRTTKLFKAWPVKMVQGDLDASGNDVLMEELEIAYEYNDIEIVSQGGTEGSGGVLGQ